MTEKQKIFADEYLIDLNATRAYKVAYPSVKKDETAAQAGSRMLRNVKVAAYIQERMEERQKRTEITQDRVLEELAAIAFARATDFAEIKDDCVIIKDTTTYNEVDDNGAIVKRNVKAPTFYAVGDMLNHVKAIEDQTKERI